MVRTNNNNRFAAFAPENQALAVMEDVTSPFYLHNGDHPGLVLVSMPLNGSNFNSWRRAMITALTAKNKIVFVDGSLLPPSTDDLLFGTWKRCNSMVISWLLNAVDRDIANSLLYFDTAMEIWNDLCDRFSQGNNPRIYQIKQQLMLLQQGSLDINTYYTKLKTLWDELRGFQPLPSCQCGGLKLWLEYQQNEYVLQFLMGLNESYSQIRAQILLMDPVPPVSKVFSLVIQEERQRAITNSASIISDPLHSMDTNLLANAANHTKARKDRDKNKLICTHCGRNNHTVDSCYKLHGFPPGYGRGAGHNKDKVKAQVNHAAGKENAACNQMSMDNLTSDQCHQLIALLSSQLQQSMASPFEDPQPNASISSFSGSFSGEDDWDG